MMMTKSKYEIGDRFTVMETIQCQIIQIILGTSEVTYILEHFDHPGSTSAIAERELDKLLAEQATF